MPKKPASTVLALLLILANSGCSHGEHTTAATAWCSEQGSVRGCYDQTFLEIYCPIKQIRSRLKSHLLTNADLPAWADKTTRRGLPIVLDLSQLSVTDVTLRDGALMDYFQHLGKPLSLDEISFCNHTVRPSEVVALYGPHVGPTRHSAKR